MKILHQTACETDLRHRQVESSGCPGMRIAEFGFRYWNFDNCRKWMWGADPLWIARLILVEI